MLYYYLSEKYFYKSELSLLIFFPCRVLTTYKSFIYYKIALNPFRFFFSSITKTKNQGYAKSKILWTFSHQGVSRLPYWEITRTNVFGPQTFQASSAYNFKSHVTTCESFRNIFEKSVNFRKIQQYVPLLGATSF